MILKKGLSLLIFSCLAIGCAFGQSNTRLWYDKPAAVWTEALPLGNGQLGAMVFGKVGDELIQLNESTLWSGGPVKANVNPGASKYLSQVREALFKEKDYEKARMLAKKMQGLFSESFLPMGDITIRQDFGGVQPANYKRDLNIGNAISTTSFTINNITYKREAFISAPDNVMVIRMSADEKGQLNFDVNATSPLHSKLMEMHGNEIVLAGKAPAHVDPSYHNRKDQEPIIYEDTSGCNGMRFQFRIKAISSDGSLTTDSSGIHVKNASEVLLLVTSATSFNGYDKCPDKDGKDENKIAQDFMTKASSKSFGQLLKNHLADFHQYFNRVALKIKDTSGNNPGALLPSDQRLKAYSDGAYDPGVEMLYFNYGRYLLISSSRPGGPPANLQGIWNKELRAPWSSNYTININTEMNYWPAESTNLSEMHQPLLNFIKNLSVAGKVTAKEFYNLNGWVANHNSDIWCLSNPVGDVGHGDPVWANWPMGGNWLSRHLWEHYRFTKNKKFLRDTAYPIMKQAAIFTLGWLVPDKEGYLVTAPSTSPENEFITTDGKKGSVSIATTMDMSIIRDLFSNLIEASAELNEDATFRELLIAKRSKLYPFHIGKKGNLEEWYQDWEDVDPHHRHTSHLFGLYPGNQISPITTPELAKAARKTLELRGDEGTGWSKAWKINFWARLLDGNHAYLLLRDLLHATRDDATNYAAGGGTYPNFFDAHPPFQIDGNFGATEGMVEMLLQSHLGDIYLLPALPDAWKEGSVTGLKARGNFEVGIHWQNRQLTSATIKSIEVGICKVRTNSPIKIPGVRYSTLFSKNTYVTTFETQKGKTYEIKADVKK
ncbi:MAG: glycoside hydrolase family 95 protein [Ginsengibacter sp.]